MANCKECLNYYICGDIWNDKAERCKHFRDRNHIVELLCSGSYFTNRAAAVKEFIKRSF